MKLTKVGVKIFFNKKRLFFFFRTVSFLLFVCLRGRREFAAATISRQKDGV